MAPAQEPMVQTTAAALAVGAVAETLLLPVLILDLLLLMNSNSKTLSKINKKSTITIITTTTIITTVLHKGEANLEIKLRLQWLIWRQKRLIRYPSHNSNNTAKVILQRHCQGQSSQQRQRWQQQELKTEVGVRVSHRSHQY
jgi:organic radical activating enzyme